MPVSSILFDGNPNCVFSSSHFRTLKEKAVICSLVDVPAGVALVTRSDYYCSRDAGSSCCSGADNMNDSSSPPNSSTVSIGTVLGS
jgi:hypothetical protein